MRILFIVLLCSILFSNCWTQSTLTAQERASQIRESRSKNFVMRSDLSDEESQELLKRLETMLDLISRYWGKKNAGIIEMYVVKDLSIWSPNMMPANAWQSVSTGGGLTITQKRSIGQVWQAKAVVYAIADRGTPQHEAVHAYCGQAFGSTGPVWYSEGMAEIGKYWAGPDDKTVHCDPYVIKYLKTSPYKPLEELVDRDQFTGDSWQNYAWRWTLCHLLGFNDNYSQRFKPLGLALMSEQPRISFASVYGTMAKEIEFEHKLFVENMDVGYRVDLCSWDWRTKFQPLRGSRTTSVKIEADHGWQASRLEVAAGQSYSYSTNGEWTLEEDGQDITADGNDAGDGRMVGIIFHDYELTEPFELGIEGTFEAECDGKLYVRCREDWSKIADNEGTVTLKLQAAR
ncbi:hypothetical protein [Rubinisphaera sp.]|uniref:hypothetical protein n=2 Tax=Rubinisphaera TaxID=1649490 RepID=UPI0025E1533B|nr:hypothetical protein [Rubinisphaera sp.]|tara:strand:- start:5133 stop:6338 length:1206 start_codon:yes stop_codon:yes gene_type:complete